jgi:hypothetical protein
VTPAERLAELFRQQSRACARLGSPLYAGLMVRAADDVLAGGPIVTAMAGHEHASGSDAVTLRLFGAVHRLVLTGAADALAAYYPSVGGIADPEAAWPVFRAVCADQLDEIRPWLERPPQTNEVGRAAGLLGGLLRIVAATTLPVRLVELGASAGLNLRPDLLRVTWDTPVPGSYGPTTSPVELPHAWTGTLPPLGVSLSVVERSGCDLEPVVPTTAEGRVRLQSYVWPDDLPRFDRLRGALELARQVPVSVVQADAARFLEGVSVQRGTTLVVWHSIFWQYLSAEARLRLQAQLDRLGGEATAAAPVAHLSLELEEVSPDAVVRLRMWPATSFPEYGDAAAIAVAAPHGIPVNWHDVASPPTQFRGS